MTLILIGQDRELASIFSEKWFLHPPNRLKKKMHIASKMQHRFQETPLSEINRTIDFWSNLHMFWIHYNNYKRMIEEMNQDGTQGTRQCNEATECFSFIERISFSQRKTREASTLPSSHSQQKTTPTIVLISGNGDFSNALSDYDRKDIGS
ncbi:hypothetical protein PROFUN_02346 [Planoprotostelium fungivorum]|uniref:Uncharacterized protein n=1 Tax=Planoprotostelium fungivorum TaxID=1890364 RepID=A0A2P6NYS0_9EUKA|nr:hypothetical protein PROFUN_02346 [Planoprotostelium fungivorum]